MFNYILPTIAIRYIWWPARRICVLISQLEGLSNQSVDVVDFKEGNLSLAFFLLYSPRFRFKPRTMKTTCSSSLTLTSGDAKRKLIEFRGSFSSRPACLCSRYLLYKILSKQVAQLCRHGRIINLVRVAVDQSLAPRR